MLVSRVRLAFKWIMRAFSGHLPPEQVLFLWDLILAYDSLEILPLLALSIVSLRRESLLTVDTLQNCEVSCLMKDLEGFGFPIHVFFTI